MSAGTDMSAKDADTTLDNAAHGGCPATTCYALHFGDCADGAPFKADAIVTDPPYQIGKAWGRKSHGKRGKSPLWGVDPEWDKLHPLVMNLPAMASKCIIWGGNNYPLPAAPHWFVWDKLQENRGADCELAWTAGTAAHKVFRMSRIDAYHNKAEGLKKTHPTQKPLPLMVWCLQQLKLPPGAMVCDPFMGSGTTGVACARLGLSFTGWEQDATHYARAKERIEAEYFLHNKLLGNP